MAAKVEAAFEAVNDANEIPRDRQALADASGEEVGPEQMSVDWIRMNAGELLGLIRWRSAGVVGD
jgi:hypothetical protein